MWLLQFQFVSSSHPCMSSDWVLFVLTNGSSPIVVCFCAVLHFSVVQYGSVFCVLAGIVFRRRNEKKPKTSAVIRLVVKGWVCFIDCHWHWSSVKYQRSRFHYCSGLDLVWNAQHVVRLQTRESKYDLNVLRFLNNSWSRFSFYMNSCCRSKSRDVRRWYVMSAFS